MIKAQSLGKVRAITENSEFSALEYDGDEPILWIQFTNPQIS